MKDLKWTLGFFGFLGLQGVPLIKQGDWTGALWFLWFIWFIYFFNFKKKKE
jgi:hypothetical protein